MGEVEAGVCVCVCGCSPDHVGEGLGDVAVEDGVVVRLLPPLRPLQHVQPRPLQRLPAPAVTLRPPPTQSPTRLPSLVPAQPGARSAPLFRAETERDRPPSLGPKHSETGPPPDTHARLTRRRVSRRVSRRFARRFPRRARRRMAGDASLRHREKPHGQARGVTPVPTPHPPSRPRCPRR